MSAAALMQSHGANHGYESPPSQWHAELVRKTAMDQRTSRHAGFTISQRCRKRIEEIFAWVKKPGGLAKTMLRGRPKVEAAFTFTVIA